MTMSNPESLEYQNEVGDDIFEMITEMVKLANTKNRSVVTSRPVQAEKVTVYPGDTLMVVFDHYGFSLPPIAAQVNTKRRARVNPPVSPATPARNPDHEVQTEILPFEINPEGATFWADFQRANRELAIITAHYAWLCEKMAKEERLVDFSPDLLARVDSIIDSTYAFSGSQWPPVRKALSTVWRHGAKFRTWAWPYWRSTGK